MTTKWQLPATAPYGKDLIVAIRLYPCYGYEGEAKVTTGTKDGSGGKASWIVEDYSNRDIEVVAWQPLPDFPPPESIN